MNFNNMCIKLLSLRKPKFSAFSGSNPKRAGRDAILTLMDDASHAFRTSTPVNVEDPGGQASTTCSFTAMKSFRDSQDSLAHVEYVVITIPKLKAVKVKTIIMFGSSHPKEGIPYRHENANRDVGHSTFRWRNSCEVPFLDRRTVRAGEWSREGMIGG